MSSLSLSMSGALMVRGVEREVDEMEFIFSRNSGVASRYQSLPSCLNPIKISEMISFSLYSFSASAKA